MGRVCVLCYHRVLDIIDDYNMINVVPRYFEEQMRVIRNNYRIIRLDDIRDSINYGDEDAVAVTFDDGYSDFLGDALSVLEKYEIPATAFITTDNIGTNTENWMDEIIRLILGPTEYKADFVLEDTEMSGYWKTRTFDQRLAFYRAFNYICRNSKREKRQDYINQLRVWNGDCPEVRKNRRILNEEEIKKLAKHPLISLGAHTVTHPSLSALTYEEQKYEIRTSKRTLEEISNSKISLFAYPFGSKYDYTYETIEILKNEGFTGAFTTEGIISNKEYDSFRIPRSVPHNMSGEAFEKWLWSALHEIDEEDVDRCQMIRKSRISYVGRAEDDFELINGSKQIVIWGCGTSGKSLLDFIKTNCDEERIVCWGDRNAKNIGQYCCGFLVKDYSFVSSLSKEKDIIIVVKGDYSWEISRDLIARDISDIHIII